MRKRILWLGLSCLLVASLVLASCAKEEVVTPGEQEEEEEVVTPGEQEEEEEEVVTPVVGEPQYGGTLTIGLAARASGADPQSPDLRDGGRTQLDFLQPIMEDVLVGDFVNRGPRGTNEFPFLMRGFNPMPFMSGQVIESWEVTEEKAIWHVRPGIYWQGRDVMESRELTADDMVAWLLYIREAPGELAFKGMSTDKIIATDRYTLEIPFSAGYNNQLMYLIGYEDRALVSPPEIQGSKSWEDQVGTGPFMFEEYVVGSYMSYLKNPIWWQTETINGVEYELPFADRMIIPIIPSMDSQVAALRTGKIDWHELIPATYWASLDQTAPQLESRRAISSYVYAASLRNTDPPFNNVNVRRAMMIGTDIKAFKTFCGVPGQPIDFFPFYPMDTSIYIPLEEMPEDIQILYDYNPTLARQMLADEGFPTGFTTTFVTSGTDATTQDLYSNLKAQWAKFGVTLDIKIYDAPSFITLQSAQQLPGSVSLGAFEEGDPPNFLYRTFISASLLNQFNRYSNARVDELGALIQKERDANEAARMAQEALLLVLEEVAVVPLYPGSDGHFWWPWLKNYYGERNVGDWGNPMPILAHVWIDQDLKAEMGYK